MYGIENIKKVIDTSLTLGKTIAEDLADGKLTSTEIFSLVLSLTGIPEIVKNWPTIKNEIGELDQAERQELYDFFVSKFDIKNDRIEILVERALQIAINLIALVEEFRALKPKPVPPTPPTPQP